MHELQHKLSFVSSLQFLSTEGKGSQETVTPSRLPHKQGFHCHFMPPVLIGRCKALTEGYPAAFTSSCQSHLVLIESINFYLNFSF